MLLGENIGSKITDISHNNIFSVVSPWTRETKEKNKQMRLHQTKSFCIAKEIINKIKR